jgi:hypothetical protein
MWTVVAVVTSSQYAAPSSAMITTMTGRECPSQHARWLVLSHKVQPPSVGRKQELPPFGLDRQPLAGDHAVGDDLGFRVDAVVRHGGSRRKTSPAHRQ